LPFLHQLRLVPRFTAAPRDPAVRRILRQMTPAVLGVSVTQINLLVDTVIASFLAGGSISWLYYSDRLVEFPVGVLGVALGTLILPGLAQRQVAAAPAEFSRLIDWGLRWVVLLGLPAMTGLIMLAGPVIATLFQSDVFDARDVHMASRSLVTYAVGLLPFLLVKVLAPGFFARQDSRTPVRFAMLAVLVNLSLSLLLMRFLQHAGLALATSLAAAVNAGLLFRGLRRGGVYRPSAGWTGLLLKAAFGSAVMGLFALLAAWPLDDWTTVSLVTRAWRLAAIVCGGVTIYFGTLWLLGVRMTDFDGRPPAAVR
jgi:putative peptidoglycan lipid II flippase